MIEKKIDYLVLGCTHYPYLIPEIRKIVGEKVEIIDSGRAVAKQTKAVLKRNHMLSSSKKMGNHQFYTNVNPKILMHFLESVHSSYQVDKLDF